MSNDQQKLPTILGITAVGVATLMFGVWRSRPSKPDEPDWQAVHRAMQRQELMEHPSLRGYSERGRRRIVDSADRFDREVEQWERQRPAR